MLFIKVAYLNLASISSLYLFFMAVLWIQNDFFGSGSFLGLKFLSGSGFGLFMKNTFEMQII